ncbi:energy transducer TonB [Cognatilysobacter lacus]|uniref:TonB C-terminal domain-containing protein n=1 Tax=Cognatilysobacter lacus TaxID=1643323 RepID=A0A5D8YJQ7_9GAMM|nr:energy transducer TonB [Lysobacter lacus]TZF80434.1 hypothetical protein FW784_14060 [Lysobacter lacus]
MKFAGVICLALLVVSHTAVACEGKNETSAKPESTDQMLARTVFNRLSPESFAIDSAAKKAYGCRYIFADTLGGLQSANPTAGGLPAAPAGPEGSPRVGKVVIAYIVTLEGVASDPVVIESTDPQLTEVALAAMKEWRFEPARFNGRPVASLAAQEFPFGPGSR